jgi:hypothetical protein
LETPEELWKLLSGKRVLHVKGFGGGFKDPLSEEQMGVQQQQEQTAVKTIGNFRPEYLVVDGDPYGSGFQRYVKAYADRQVGAGLAVPELVWVKSVKGISPTPEEREKRLGQAREWADKGLHVVVSWLPEANISQGVDRLFGAGCWEKLQGQKFDFRGAVRLLEAAEPDRPEWLRGLTCTAPGREMYLAIKAVEDRADDMQYFEKCSFENAAKGNAIYQHMRGEGQEPAAQGAVSFGGGESVLLEFATLYLFPGSGFDADQAALFPFSRGRPSDPTLPAHAGRAFESELELLVKYSELRAAGRFEDVKEMFAKDARWVTLYKKTLEDREVIFAWMNREKAAGRTNLVEGPWKVDGDKYSREMATKFPRGGRHEVVQSAVISGGYIREMRITPKWEAHAVVIDFGLAREKGDDQTALEKMAQNVVWKTWDEREVTGISAVAELMAEQRNRGEKRDATSDFEALGEVTDEQGIFERSMEIQRSDCAVVFRGTQTLKVRGNPLRITEVYMHPEIQEDAHFVEAAEGSRSCFANVCRVMCTCSRKIVAP